MKLLLIRLSTLLFVIASSLLHADSTSFFKIIPANPGVLSIELCLNGKGPLTCQNYSVSALTLKISTTVSNHYYPSAGIKLLSQGYKPTGCTYYSNGFCLFALSDTAPATIHLNSDTPLQAIVSPGSLKVDLNQTAVFNVSALQGTSPYHYQWYSCTTTACTSTTPIMGAISNSYSPSTTTAGIYYYQAQISDSAQPPETAESAGVTLSVGNTLSATITPPSQIVGVNHVAAFIVDPNGGTPSYSYQWYSCTTINCLFATPIAGAISNTYNPSTATAGTYYYQAQVTDSALVPNSLTTSTVSLLVSPDPIIFVTNGATTGAFSTGATDNGDSYCSSQASTGNPRFNVNDYNYRALTITSNQYPCNYINGIPGCMTQNSVTYNTSNWPLIAGTEFINPDGSTYATVTQNGIFDGNAYGLQYSDGTSSHDPLWVGIQELGIDNVVAPTSITAWGWNDLNPGTLDTQDGNQYGIYGPGAYGGSCMDWSVGTNSYFGTLGSAGSSSQFTYENPSVPFNALYGNYEYWTNVSQTPYLSTELSANNYDHCDQNYHVVCLAFPK